MKQEEPTAGLPWIPRVQRVDGRTRGRNDLLVVWRRFADRIREVAQDREVNVRIEIADRLDLEVIDESVDTLDAVDDRWYDHHRPRISRKTVVFQPRQAARRYQRGEDALDDLNGKFARRHDDEKANQQQAHVVPTLC